MVRCPGCGLELPGVADEVSTRPGASAACWRLFGEVQGYEMQHLAQVGRFHQLLVDTYAAQHPVSDGPTIGVAFALIGLHLALDEGWRGDQVRDAHQAMARAHREWPRFRPPDEHARSTVFDLAMAASPEAYAEALWTWASEVWEAWRDAHQTVDTLLMDMLPADEWARLKSG